MDKTNAGTLLFRNKYRIPTARLQHWDYGQDGWYYVTICTKKRKCFFGRIKNHKMLLSRIGKIVQIELLKTECLRKNVKLLTWAIMPNHVHLIILISNEEIQTFSLKQEYKNRFGPQTNNLSSIIRGIKSTCKKQISQCFPSYNFYWQERFYDHIIRREKSLYKIGQYILNNPSKWEIDRNNPKNVY